MGNVIHLRDRESGLDFAARMARIRASLDKINALMAELKSNDRTAQEAWNEIAGLLTWKQYQRVTVLRGKAVTNYEVLLLRAKRLSGKRRVKDLCDEGLVACREGRYK